VRKEPYVSVAIRFTLKNTPPGHRGLCSENWTLGRDTDKPFWALGYSIILRLTEFWFNQHPEVSEAEMVEQLGELGEAISGMRLAIEASDA
jgi:hypothetical protein